MKAYKTAVENLQAARKLIRTRWIPYRLAKTADNVVCSPRNPKAHSFCALGAVRHVNGPGELKAASVLRQAARKILREKGKHWTGNPIFEVNDRLGKEITLEMFAKAIEIAKK